MSDEHTQEKEQFSTQRINGITVGIAHIQDKKPSQEDRFYVGSKPASKKSAEKWLRKTFADIAATAQEPVGGSTATVAVLSPKKQLTLAHLGDSPAVLFIRNVQGEWREEELIEPHNAFNPAEKQRVEAAGGRTWYERLLGEDEDSLAMTRSFGDKRYVGISDHPEITHIDLSQKVRPGEQAFLLLSSDGVLTRRYKEDGSYTHIPDLMDLSFDFQDCYDENSGPGLEERVATALISGKFLGPAQRIKDNKTALVINLNQPYTQDIVAGLFDGHSGSVVAQKAADGLQKAVEKEKKRASRASLLARTAAATSLFLTNGTPPPNEQPGKSDWQQRIQLENDQSSPDLDAGR